MLKAWNKGKVEPSHIVGEWTKFLKSLTPRSVVDNMRPEPREKVHRRWDYLMEIYEVADMEEQYRSFGMGKRLLSLITIIVFDCSFRR